MLHSSKEVCKSVAWFLEMEEGEKVLIIADGWDELDKSELQEGSFLYTLLFEDLPFVSLILTSRPATQHIEIHGFSRVRSLDYIWSEFDDDKDKARRLLKQIRDTPFVESIHCKKWSVYSTLHYSMHTHTKIIVCVCMLSTRVLIACIHTKIVVSVSITLPPGVFGPQLVSVITSRERCA